MTTIPMNENRENYLVKFNEKAYDNINYLQYMTNIKQGENVTSSIDFLNVTLDEMLRKLINEEKYHETISIINSLTFNLLRELAENVGVKIRDPSEIPMIIQEMKNKNVIDEKTRDQLIISFLIKEGITTQVYEYNKKLSQRDVEKMTKILRLLEKIAKKTTIGYSDLYFTKPFESTSLSYLT